MSAVRPSRRTAALWFGFLALCCLSNLEAENGRNFAASYQLQNVHSDGSTVSFNLSLKLFNYSGVDLSDGKVTFVGRLVPPGAANDFGGEFEHVSIKYRKYADLKGNFTVPESEYQEWQRGATPNLIVSYINEAGDSIQNRVELSKTR